MKSLSYIAIIMLFLITLMAGVEAKSYPQSQNLTIRVGCDEIDCTQTFTVTVQDPDNIVIINDAGTTIQNGYLNFSILSSFLSKNGEYNGFLEGNGVTPDYKSFSFTITPNGEEPTTAKAFFYLGLLALLVFFICLIFWAHMQDQSELARFWWFSFMWLPIWATFFIGWSMARDFLTSQGAIESILYLAWLVIAIVYPFFLLGLVLYTFYYIYKQKEVQRLITRGFSLEDAQNRVSGGKGRGMDKW